MQNADERHGPIKILVFGRLGQVATELKRRADLNLNQKFTWNFIGQNQNAFASAAMLTSILEVERPNIIINTSAYTGVDKAEAERDLADRLNHLAPAWIGSWAAKQGCSVVHFSTDYVYPGTKDNYWLETDSLAPQNWYGVTKMLGDKALQESGCHHLILRTSWVYSSVGVNFVKTMLRMGAEKETLSIVCDQFGSPTSAKDLAEVVFAIIQSPRFRQSRGVYHYCGQGVTSWYGFANEIFQQAKSLGFKQKISEIIAIPTSLYPTPAARPLNSRLDCSKIIHEFGLEAKPWQTSLRIVLNELRTSDDNRVLR